MIIPLHPNSVGRIWLAADSRYTIRSLREHLEHYPHLGWMSAEGGDYIVGGYWKDRPPIGLIVEASASPQRSALAQRLLQSFAESGSELAVLSEREAAQALPLYLDLGFTAREEVVCYERVDVRVPLAPRRLHVRRLEEKDLPALVKMERETFPWLWWETTTTFRQMNQRPDTWVMVAYLDDDLVGYLILAVRNTWGHLNRIGVHPTRQGQGFGRELLAVAIDEMARRGARTLGLNTQSDNTRSQHLYEAFGFTQTGETFHIYGKWL